MLIPPSPRSLPSPPSSYPNPIASRSERGKKRKKKGKSTKGKREEEGIKDVKFAERGINLQCFSSLQELVLKFQPLSIDPLYAEAAVRMSCAGPGNTSTTVSALTMRAAIDCNSHTLSASTRA